MYHFFSAVGDGGAADGSTEPASDADDADSGAVSVSSGAVALSIDDLREVRPDEVEEAEDHRRQDRHDDDDDRGRADLLRRRPGDLLQLGSNFVGGGVLGM